MDTKEQMEKEETKCEWMTGEEISFQQKKSLERPLFGRLDRLSQLCSIVVAFVWIILSTVLPSDFILV